MAILRTIRCDVCGKEEREAGENTGWPGWGGLQGIVFNGVANPNLCPDDLRKTAAFVDALTTAKPANGD